MGPLHVELVFLTFLIAVTNYQQEQLQDEFTVAHSVKVQLIMGKTGWQLDTFQTQDIER